MTAEFKNKCRWTTSDGTSFPHSDCTITYGFAGMLACSDRLTPYGTVYGVTFPNGPSVRIEVDCPNNIYASENNILIYDVDGRSAFKCPEKTDEYNHNICFWNGEKIQFHTGDHCC